MKKFIIIFSLTILLAGPALSEMVIKGVNVGLDVDLIGKQMDGHTTYRLVFEEWVPYYYTVFRGRSELEFPLDVNMGGAAVNFHGKIAKKLPWKFEIEYFKSYQDPSKFMKDSDWEEIPTYGINDFFSYTESDVTLDAKTYDISLSLGVINRPVIKVFGKQIQGFSQQ